MLHINSFQNVSLINCIGFKPNFYLYRLINYMISYFENLREKFELYWMKRRHIWLLFILLNCYFNKLPWVFPETEKIRKLNNNKKSISVSSVNQEYCSNNFSTFRQIYDCNLNKRCLSIDLKLFQSNYWWATK